MKLINQPQLMRERVRELKREGKRIAFVPTMGALHEGHLSLIDIAKEHGDAVVVSIYLNPKQFGPNEDLESYPSDLERDLELAKQRGADIVFCPSDEVMYPEGFETYVVVEQSTKNLCGASRPGFFRGVTTVVCKLFNIVEPDVAVFGKKDYQQLQVIKRLVTDLNLNIEIVAGEIVREADGLAMSSRNRYLNPSERLAARSISEAIRRAEEEVKNGKTDINKILTDVKNHIESNGVGRVDYVKICDPETLEELEELKCPALLATAAFFGKARLIDNCILQR